MAPAPMTDRELLLRLLRTAMRQCAAYLEVQIAIETALGLDHGSSEIREYVESLAPEFLHCPESLTVDHVEPLLHLDRKPHFR